MLAISLKTLSFLHLYRSCITATEHPYKMCAIGLFFSYSLSNFFHTACSYWTAASPQCCRLAGEGSVSYPDRNKNYILNWSIFHKFHHVILCCGSSHLLQAHCLPSSAAFYFLTSRTSLLISPWTILLFSVFMVGSMKLDKLQSILYLCMYCRLFTAIMIYSLPGQQLLATLYYVLQHQGYLIWCISQRLH